MRMNRTNRVSLLLGMGILLGATVVLVLSGSPSRLLTVSVAALLLGIVVLLGLAVLAAVIRHSNTPGARRRPKR